MPLTTIFVGWALPTMLEKLILSMVGNAHPTLGENGARSQICYYLFFCEVPCLRNLLAQSFLPDAET
jgi:hypothetical protein